MIEKVGYSFIFISCRLQNKTVSVLWSVPEGKKREKSKSGGRAGASHTG